MIYSPLQAASKFIKFYTNASNSKGHGTHSPFVFDFITKVLNDKTRYEPYRQVETLRKQLLKDNTALLIEDFGAGSAKSNANSRTVAEIARHAAKPSKYGQLLHRMVKFYKAKQVLELGTSLGITTAYLASADDTVQVTTMEGATAVAAKAAENFRQLQLNNIRVVRGNFDETLAPVLDAMGSVDLAYVDGNHRQEPTERYFQQLLSYVHDDSLLIFDDIHWSAGMEAAWHTISQHPRVTCSIDLFHIGIVGFNKSFKEKQSFSIRY